jgi:phage-related protein (TIGR01555 family)
MIKPRVRVAAGSTKNLVTRDSYQNFVARLGVGTGNQADGGSYGFNPITRNRIQLEAMYRGSWLVGRVVDAPAEDMTREWVEYKGTLAPEQHTQMAAETRRLGLRAEVNDVAKWARLYGGAVGVIQINGQDTSTPLRPETVAKGQLQGIAVLDRWMLNPSFSDLVQAPGPDFGKPTFYKVNAGDTGFTQNQAIHYSRVVRLEGVRLPFFQRQYENGWGLSVIERLFDRLLAFDSTTQGAAQLVYKAHLRTVSVENLREIIAAGGPAMAALTKMFEMIRFMQSNEGLTLIDAKDKFETHQYAFSGLSDILMQFGEQLSGASEIPLVRLFGQSPAGLNSSGESDLRNYYDGISNRQEIELRPGLSRLLPILFRSTFGADPPPDFDFDFVPLWQLSDTDRAEIADKTTTSIGRMADGAIIDRSTALRELKATSRVTGLFGSITDEDIAEAEAEPPLAMETQQEPGDGGEGGGEGEEGQGQKPEPEAQ